MATILEPQQWQTDQRFVLHGVSWRFYELLLEEIGDRPIRVTYDRGNLELMSPSPAHEIWKTLLGRMIEMLTFELDIPMRSGGSMTFRREELERGLEPDECYWIASVSLLPRDREYDPQRDPPPDLGIEIEYSRSALDRQGIYAALRVPEIWRYDGDGLHVALLQANGEYALSKRSAAFPFLPIGELTRFLQSEERSDETAWMRGFVKWVREQGFRA